MTMLSRRTVDALTVFLSLLFAGATPAFAMSDEDLVQALRAGGHVIVVRHGATFPDQADTDPLNFDNVAAQRNLRARRWRANSETRFAAQASPSARSIRASTTAPTRPRCSPASRRSRRRRTSPRAASSCRPTRTTAAPKHFARCSRPRRSRRQYRPHHAFPKYYCRARQGLVRREGGWGLDLPSADARRPHRDGRVAPHRGGGEIAAGRSTSPSATMLGKREPVRRFADAQVHQAEAPDDAAVPSRR